MTLLRWLLEDVHKGETHATAESDPRIQQSCMVRWGLLISVVSRERLREKWCSADLYQGRWECGAFSDSASYHHLSLSLSLSLSFSLTKLCVYLLSLLVPSSSMNHLLAYLLKQSDFLSWICCSQIEIKRFAKVFLHSDMRERVCRTSELHGHLLGE